MACDMKAYKILPFRFSRFNGKKVLVVNECGEFLFLDKQQFDDMVNYKLSLDSDVFLNLKAKQILSDTELAPVINMLAIKYRTKKSFLNNFTSLHMVVPTLRCNSKCRYCQVSSKQISNKEFDMSRKTAKKTVDMIFRSPSPVVKIEFQGGEPLLNMDIVKFIIGYAKKLNRYYKKHLEFVICTNLSLITDKILKYLKRESVYISTSLDGPKDLHNNNRPLQNTNDSYTIVIENIKKSQAFIGKDKVSALMTTTKGSLPRFTDIIDEYVKLGFNHIFFRALNPYGLAKRDKLIFEYGVDDFIKAYTNALEYIINLNIKGVFFAEDFASLLLTRILTPFPTGFVDMQSPSGAGISAALYNFDGNVYASDEGRMLASVGDHRFLMGNVNKNKYEEIFYGDRIKELVNSSCLECLPGCSDCALQSFCGADPVRNYAEQGDIVGNRPTSDMCKKNKTIINYLLGVIKNKDPNISNVFWSWITRRY